MTLSSSSLKPHSVGRSQPRFFPNERAHETLKRNVVMRGVNDTSYKFGTLLSTQWLKYEIVSGETDDFRHEMSLAT